MSWGLARLLLKRILLPPWAQRKRMLRVEAWSVVIASYVLLAIAYLWPQNYRNESPPFVIVAWLAFLVRVLQFHLGLLLLAVACVAAFVRGRRLLLAAAPPVLFTLGPAWWGYLRGPPARPAPLGAPVLRVMTANLLMVNATRRASSTRSRRPGRTCCWCRNTPTPGTRHSLPPCRTSTPSAAS